MTSKKSDNDSVRFRGGFPALKWLAKRDPDAAAAIWKRIRSAASTEAPIPEQQAYLNPVERIADDAGPHVVPDEVVTSETMAEPVQDGPDEVWPDMLHEVRPSERDICSALGWIEWPNSSPRRSEPIGWCMRCPCGMLSPIEGRNFRPVFDGHLATLGGMSFYTKPSARKLAEGGMMVSYTDSAGRIQRPAYVASKPRGGKRPRRTRAAAQAYVDSRPAIPSPMHVGGYQRPMSGESALMPMLARTSACEAARASLDQALANTQIMPHVTRCPPGLPWKGARFIAGISGAKQTASTSAPNWEEPASPLSSVLDEVAARGTLQSIGVRLGFNGGYADRAGKKALLAEGRALVASNTNSQKATAA